MFSRLEEVQECLDKAGLSESSCIDGIRKADVVVEQCHDDIGLWCSILMKRARLLFTAVSVSVCLSACVQVLTPTSLL